MTASAEHQGAQQLALAGAGGADEQAVRAHAVLRGLLEVQLDRRGRRGRRRSAPAAGRGWAARPQARPGRTRPGRRCRAGRPAPSSAVTAPARSATTRPDSRSGASCRASPSARARARSRSARPTRVVPSVVVPVHGRRRRRRRAPASRGRAGAAGGRSGRRMVTPVDAALGHQVVGAGARRRRPAPPRTCGALGRRRRRVEPRPVGQHVVEHRLQRRPRSGRPAAAGPAASVFGRVLGVRQPLRPLPPRRRGPGRRSTATSRSSGAWKVASWATHRADQPAHRASGRRAGRPGRSRAARSRPAGRAPPSRCVDEPAQRHRAHRLQVLDRLGLRRDQRGGQLLRAEPDPDLAEVGVARAGAPTAGALAAVDHSVRPGRGGGSGSPALLARPFADAARSWARWRMYCAACRDHLGLLGGRPWSSPSARSCRAWRRRTCHRPHSHRAGRAGTAHHQPIAADTGRHGQDHQQLGPGLAAGRRHLRRRIEHHLAGGQRRRRPARRSLDHDGAHRFTPVSTAVW